MTFEIVQATAAGLEHILANASHATRAEFHDTPDFDPSWLYEAVGREDGDAYQLEHYGDTERPSAMLGSIHAAPGRRLFWFICTEKYWSLGRQGLRLTNSHLDIVRAKWPGVRFESHSYSRHPGTDAWFRLIGFTLERVVADCKVFVLRR